VITLDAVRRGIRGRRPRPPLAHLLDPATHRDVRLPVPGGERRFSAYILGEDITHPSLAIWLGVSGVGMLFWAWQVHYRSTLDRFRDVLEKFADGLRLAFPEPMAPSAPVDWETLAARTPWPLGGNYDMPEAVAAREFLASIYVPPSPQSRGKILRDRSSITDREDFNAFKTAHHVMAECVEDWCGHLPAIWGFFLFTECEVRSHHRHALKILAYAELALQVAYPHEPTQKGLRPGFKWLMTDLPDSGL
jgi:hypothetical protein